MAQPPPAAPGMSVEEIDTPALIVDLDTLDRNLAAMAALVAGTGVSLRPHAKTHKSPVIARRQIERGARGVCVQKVAEAEALAWGGIDDILVSNEVVSAAKLARLAALSTIAEVVVCADDVRGIDAIAAAAQAAGTRLGVRLEVEVGGGRCGAAPEDAARLAGRIAASPHLRFDGLQAYNGTAQHIRSAQARAAAARASAAVTARTVAAIRGAGLAVATVGGAGTGTVLDDARSGVFTELQPGSYCFMDADYAANLDPDAQPIRSFAQALFVLTRVMSAPRPGVAVVDAGHKAVAVDSGLPLVSGRPDLQYVSASDEHGKIVFAADVAGPELGETLALVPGHCDPTVDRFDWYVVVRDRRVVGLWPVTARGAMS